jgi:hypothetical protein
VTSPDLPRPLTTDHKLLVALATRLDGQNELLAAILDRMPERPQQADTGTVELREPAPPTAHTSDAEKAADGSTEPPPPPARRTRKTTPRTKPKGSS